MHPGASWKLSELGFFLVHVFPYLEWIRKFNTQIFVFSRYMRKYGPKNKSKFRHFLQSESLLYLDTQKIQMILLIIWTDIGIPIFRGILTTLNSCLSLGLLHQMLFYWNFLYQLEWAGRSATRLFHQIYTKWSLIYPYLHCGKNTRATN